MTKRSAKDGAHLVPINLSSGAPAHSVGEIKEYDAAAVLAEFRGHFRWDEKLVNRAEGLIRAHLNKALSDALYIFIYDEIPHLLNEEDGIDPKLRRRQAQRIIRRAEVRLRERLMLPTKRTPRGRPRKWSKAKLQEEIKEAAKAIVDRGEDLNLKAVAAEMRNDKKALSENTLKRLLQRYAISWKAIKRAHK